MNRLLQPSHCGIERDASISLPHSKDVERGILSAMLLDPETVVPKVKHVAPQIYLPGNRIVFDAIVELFEGGGEFSIIELSEYLKTRGDLAKVGEVKTLAEFYDLREDLPSVSLIDSLLPILLEKYQKRCLYELCSENAKASLNGHEPAELLEGLRERVEDISKVSNSSGDFPSIISVDELIKSKETMPEVLIKGLLSVGAKMLVTGGSKSYKSWALQGLAVSVASGFSFLKFECRKGRVLYVNLEIREAYLANRLREVGLAMDLNELPQNLDILNLRGFSDSAEKLIPRLIEQIKSSSAEYDLVVIDPIYKILGDRDENSTRDIADLFRELERLSEECQVAIAMAHHHAKGNASNRSAIDRGSGSGVFAREPDALVDFLPGRIKDDFTVNLTLRDFPPMDPFIVSWSHPLFVVNERHSAGVPSEMNGLLTTEDILKHLPETGLQATEWQRQCAAKGIGRTRFYELKKRCESLGLVSKDRAKKRFFRCNESSASSEE